MRKRKKMMTLFKTTTFLINALNLFVVGLTIIYSNSVYIINYYKFRSDNDYKCRMGIESR